MRTSSPSSKHSRKARTRAPRFASRSSSSSRYERWTSSTFSRDIARPLSRAYDGARVSTPETPDNDRRMGQCNEGANGRVAVGTVSRAGAPSATAPSRTQAVRFGSRASRARFLSALVSTTTASRARSRSTTTELKASSLARRSRARSDSLGAAAPAGPRSRRRLAAVEGDARPRLGVPRERARPRHR
jgi:hypothetical protein